MNYTHEHRLLKRKQRANKAIKAFFNFWFTIQFEYKFCFVCGRNIPKLFNHTAIQPFGKKGDWVHKNCFDNFITFGDAKSKLDENSRLICHVQPAFSKSPSDVCRVRVNNNNSAVVEHLLKHSPCIVGFFDEYRKRNFLKPNGKKFLR